MDDRYTITEAAKILNVHAHTLRYWEEELHLDIPRNELGHRVYYQEQLELFNEIKNLKEEGYQLNAIKMQIMSMTKHEIKKMERDINSASKADKMEKFQELMTDIIRNAMVESQEEMKKQITTTIIKEMNYLSRENNEQQEARYKKLDEAIRQYGKNRQKRTKKEKVLWGQKDAAKKLKEELINNKKEAITRCEKIIT